MMQFNGFLVNVDTDQYKIKCFMNIYKLTALIDCLVNKLANIELIIGMEQIDDKTQTALENKIRKAVKLKLNKF